MLAAAAAAALVSLLLVRESSVHAGSLHFTKEPKSQDALHGRSAMLRCEVSQSEGVVYSWLQNGQPVSDSERRFQKGASLKFSSVDRLLDAGTFQCVASLSSSGEEARSTNASFNIKWLESRAVALIEPQLEEEIQSSVSVTLRCDIDGHPRPTCQWFRDGVHLQEETQLINNKERTLTLPAVGLQDNGVYYCCASNAAGHTCSNANFSLHIIDESTPRPVVVPESLVVFRNQAALLNCLFTAQPPPKLSWYHEDEPVTNKSRLFLLSNGSLLISQVKPRNTGLYKCVATAERGAPVSVEATVRIAELEDFGLAYPRVFEPNTLQSITCSPPRAFPPPRVWWEHGGERVPAESNQSRVYHDDLNLVFNPILKDDAGSYTCVVQNLAGTRKQEIAVMVASPPEWLKGPEDSQLEEGQPGFLHCHAQATPPPTVTWYRNALAINQEDVRYKLFPNGTLRINSVEVFDRHVYVCQSQNAAGRLEGHARVYVLEKLKFTPTPQPSQCLELDKEAVVQCSATGRLTPSIHWSRADGSELPHHVIQIGSGLRFTKVMRADTGSYTCHASNSLQGEISASVQLTVAVYITFRLEPENTTVYRGHTAVLHCQATGDPPPFIQWKKKDKFLEPHNSRFQKLANGSLLISDVAMEDTGSYTCIAGNNCNIGHTTAQLYVVERPVHFLEDEEKTPYRMIQTVGLSVGAAVAYIIIVLGLMLYCKRRRQAKRQGKEEEGETQQLNGQAPADPQVEVALSSLAPTADAGTSSQRHGNHDPVTLPRSNLTPLQTLGRGEFGEVFLAKAKGLAGSGGKGGGEEEVLVLAKALQSREEVAQQEFCRQVDMFSKVDHQNLTRLLAVCTDTEPHYLLLEYGHQKGDLKQYLKMTRTKEEKPEKTHNLSTKQKVGVCLQIARAMEHLSNQRFVHRDLAARNCVVSSRRHVRVSCLGLSKDVYSSEYHQVRQALLPVRWLPSEAVFEDDFSTKTDVWSYGVLMWEVFTQGELPHSGMDYTQLMEALKEGSLKLPLPPGCPSRVYKLMCQCWSLSPKDRPGFTEVLTALSNLPSDTKV
ncbi:inactive tyrosine-protein kinase 7a [Lampris incognitus]|uniref:inactive tyrosine-protein kinase 7a n=1 Tax=Lampris incognitus TaxID=2546036 RepID=UPI0024B5C98E|nr:inactive tyrosine-protein kinase 7a [Lampris incognitus]